MKTKKEIESALLPNGLQDGKWPKERPGMINAYSCPRCLDLTVTVVIDWGTTPFILGCRVTEGCDGDARSMFYRCSPQAIGRLTHGWYRPDDTGPGMKHEVDRIREMMLARGASEDDVECVVGQTVDHVEAGGLLIRRLTPAEIVTWTRSAQS